MVSSPPQASRPTLDTDMRKLLTLRLDQCRQCRTLLEENVALVMPDDENVLSELQIRSVLGYLGEVHLNHTRH